MKSINQGDTWEQISPNLSISANPQKKSTAAGMIAESKLQAGLLYVGTDHGAFWCSKNDGKDWTEYSSDLTNQYIRSICMVEKVAFSFWLMESDTVELVILGDSDTVVWSGFTLVGSDD